MLLRITYASNNKKGIDSNQEEFGVLNKIDDGEQISKETGNNSWYSEREPEKEKV